MSFFGTSFVPRDPVGLADLKDVAIQETDAISDYVKDTHTLTTGEK